MRGAAASHVCGSALAGGQQIVPVPIVWGNAPAERAEFRCHAHGYELQNYL